MPVPIPGLKVGSDIQKVKFLTTCGRPKPGFFFDFGVFRAAQTQWIWLLWRPGQDCQGLPTMTWEPVRCPRMAHDGPGWPKMTQDGP